MGELPEIVNRALTVHDAIAGDLSGFGGILRCNVCHGEQRLGDLASHLSTGWPQHCGQTMTWVTLKELAREQREVPEGYELVAVPAPDWRIETEGTCRRQVKGHRACGAPAVAALNRSHYGNARPNWWKYCISHLYGHWIQDGQVTHWILREVGDAQSPE